MTVISSHNDMRALMDAVSINHATISEAKPYGFLQQLKLKVASPFSLSKNRELVLNQYANDLYSEWKSHSKLIQSRTGQAPSARDFVTWYSSSPQQPGRADPVKSSLVLAQIRTLPASSTASGAAINLDDPLNDAQLEELTRKISGMVLTQATKTSNKLLGSASAEEEQQVYDAMQTIDDYLIRGAARISPNYVFNAMRKIWGADTQVSQAISRGWQDFLKAHAAGASTLVLPLAPAQFKPNKTSPFLTDSQKDMLVQILPELLLHVRRSINRSTQLEPVKQPRELKPKSGPELTPANYEAKYKEWDAAMTPLGFKPEDIKKLVDKHFGIG